MTWSLGFRLVPGTALHQASPVSKKVGGLPSWSMTPFPETVSDPTKDPDIKPQTSLASQQLMKFSWQVADGMSYLSSRAVS